MAHAGHQRDPWCMKNAFLSLILKSNNSKVRAHVLGVFEGVGVLVFSEDPLNYPPWKDCRPLPVWNRMTADCHSLLPKTLRLNSSGILPSLVAAFAFSVLWISFGAPMESRWTCLRPIHSNKMIAARVKSPNRIYQYGREIVLTCYVFLHWQLFHHFTCHKICTRTNLGWCST